MTMPNHGCQVSSPSGKVSGPAKLNVLHARILSSIFAPDRRGVWETLLCIRYKHRQKAGKTGILLIGVLPWVCKERGLCLCNVNEGCNGNVPVVVFGAVRVEGDRLIQPDCNRSFYGHREGDVASPCDRPACDFQFNALPDWDCDCYLQ